MKGYLKVVVIVVLSAILLGAVCIGVGLMTGADFPRIYSILDNRYHITIYYDYFLELISAVKEAVII